EYVAADLAHQHIIQNQDTFRRKLSEGGYTGFNLARAAVHLQDLEEEIYIILDSEPSEQLRDALEEVARPFSLTVVDTSVQDEIVENSLQENSEAGGEQSSGTGRDQDNGSGSEGEDRDNNGRQGREMEGGGEGGMDSGSGSGSGNGNTGGGGEDGDEDEDERKEKQREDGNDDDGDQEAPAQSNEIGSHQSGSIIIPFSSYLTSPKHDQNFEICCHVRIK
ncbi:hypothetical protein H0H93_015041, partial [Arthromyces matolae]